MKTFDEKLNNLLKSEPTFVDDAGRLLEWKLQTSALTNDPTLIRLLLSDDSIKEKFFVNIDWISLFKSDVFINYISYKNFLDNSYTKYKNRIWLRGRWKFYKDSWDVSLVWPFKDCVLEWWQTKEDEKKKEIFFNEILAQDEIDKLFSPKVFTNLKKYDESWEHQVDWFTKDENGFILDNFVIKWNNLLTLHSLKKKFRWRIKLIYIDPPYNTWNDWFNYNDNFNRSSWLTFMKNRLEIARELLSWDWSIYVNIDYNQVHYLKVLMDEVFWEDNFQREIIWRMWFLSWYKTAVNNFIRNHDTILFYSKDPKLLDFKKTYIDNKDFKEQLKKSNDLIKFMKKYWLEESQVDEILQYINHDSRWERYPLEDTRNCNKWDDLNSIAIDSSTSKVEETVDLDWENFKWQKPEKLLKRIIESATDEWDYVLDFFWGTWTTAAAAHKMNRRYIVCEQMDYINETIVPRMIDVINWDTSWISQAVDWKWWWEFIYCELKKYNWEFIEQIETAKNIDELLKIREEMKSKAYFDYNFDMKEFENSIDDFRDLSLDEQKKVLIEILNKNQLYVNLSDIDDEDFEVDDEDKKLNSDFYN